MSHKSRNLWSHMSPRFFWDRKKNELSCDIIHLGIKTYISNALIVINLLELQQPHSETFGLTGLFTLCIWCTDKLNGWLTNKYLRIIKKYFLFYSLDNKTRYLHKTLEVSYLEVSIVKLPYQRSSRLNVGVYQ